MRATREATRVRRATRRSKGLEIMLVRASGQMKRVVRTTLMNLRGGGLCQWM